MFIKEEYLEELAFLEMEEIKEMLIKFLDNNYYLPYILESRVKSISKLKQKLQLHISRGITGENVVDILDIIGFRISVDNEDEVINMVNLMQRFASYLRLKDQFNNPRSTGFKAFSYYYDCFGFNTEIQIMTKDMREWTNGTHKKHDERKYGLIRNRV